jgi:hypothetical protein
MQNEGWLFLAILIAYGCAVVTPLLRYRLRGRVGAFVGWCIMPIILSYPPLEPDQLVAVVMVWRQGGLDGSKHAESVLPHERTGLDC